MQCAGTYRQWQGMSPVRSPCRRTFAPGSPRCPLLADFVAKVLEGFSDRRRSDNAAKMIPRETAMRIAIPHAAIIWIGNLFRDGAPDPARALTDFYNKIGTTRKNAAVPRFRQLSGALPPWPRG